MLVDILSLFPDYFSSPLQSTILARAQQSGLLTVACTDIRDFSHDPWRRVDDRPFGGGPGMVMMPEPVALAIRSKRKVDSHVVYLSPRGKPLTAQVARKLATYPHLILLCGHYEGVDQRVLDSEIDEEISIGDYVLTNGCLASLVLIDAAARFIPGVLGHEEAAEQDSFEDGLLDCPHYTRPIEFEGKEVPEVLRSGDHQKIARFRTEQKLEWTRKNRPDLYMRYIASENDEIEQAQGACSFVTLQAVDLHLMSKFWKAILGSKSVKLTDVLEIQLGSFRLIYVSHVQKGMQERIQLSLGLQVQEMIYRKAVGYLKRIEGLDSSGLGATLVDPEGNILYLTLA